MELQREPYPFEVCFGVYDRLVILGVMVLEGHIAT